MASARWRGWVSQYLQSQAWAGLAIGTRRQREPILRKLTEAIGAEPFANIDRKSIVAAIAKRKDTPFAAATFLKALRGLFAYAIDAELMSSDPSVGLKIKRPPSEGFHCWTPEEVDQFKVRWPIGTRERLAFVLLVETGLRRADIVKLGRQHVGSDGFIRFKTSKTGDQVVIPMSGELADTIAASPTGDMIFFATINGSPMKDASFGNWFGEACVAAGVPGRAHGLRKRRAVNLAEVGGTTSELNATLGWRGDKMASHYTRAANKDKLVNTLADKMRTRAPAPSNPVRTTGKKDE